MSARSVAGIPVIGRLYPLRSLANGTTGAAAAAAAAQSLEDGCSLGRAQAGARVPAGAGIVIGVAAGLNVVEGLRVLVQDRVDEPGVVAQLLIPSERKGRGTAKAGPRKLSMLRARHYNGNEKICRPGGKGG